MRIFQIYIAIISIAILGVSAPLDSAHAGENNPDQEAQIQQKIRQLANEMDFGALEELFSTAHQASVRGQLPYDDLRSMFRVFQSTAPEIQEFTESWLDDDPESPYALTALTWNLYTAGWHMRGPNTPSMTHPQSLIRFQILHSRASRLAARAYEIAPDLVPASDAIIRLMLTSRKTNISPDHDATVPNTPKKILD